MIINNRPRPLCATVDPDHKAGLPKPAVTRRNDLPSRTLLMACSAQAVLTNPPKKQKIVQLPYSKALVTPAQIASTFMRRAEPPKNKTDYLIRFRTMSAPQRQWCLLNLPDVKGPKCGLDESLLGAPFPRE